MITIQSYGESVKLLPCLGKEEARLFKKKEKGVLYKLNQELINLMVNIPNTTLAKNYSHLICSNKYSASKRLLMYGIIYREKIFSVESRKNHQANYFISQLPTVFFHFLSNIQSEMPSAKCLEKEIPEIKYFLDRYKYLQTELSEKELFLREGIKIRKIFKDLSSYSLLYNRCKKRN